MTQRTFWFLTALWALFAYLVLVESYWLGREFPIVASVLAVFAMYVASPIAMWHSAVAYEYRTFREVFDLKIGAWSFLIGELVVWPVAAVFTVVGWHEAVPAHSTQSRPLLLGCLGIGVALGGLFHFVNGRGYRSVGAQEALDSPTKITHDFCAYPVLSGGLIYGAIPLVQDWGWYSWAIGSCVIVWFVLCARDVIAGLDPKLLHPRWSGKLFRKLRWPSS